MESLLEYMKSVIEGDGGLIPLHRWLKKNSSEIESYFSRDSFLRMKCGNPLYEFRRILTERNIAFTNSPNAYLPSEPEDFSWIKPEWLTERLVPFFQSPSSYGTLHKLSVNGLLYMVEIKRTGDELWRFSTPEATWSHMMGRAGIALVRDGKVIYAVITLLN